VSRKPVNLERGLQILAATLAAIPFVSGLAGMIAGPATLPGDNCRFESSAESEDRFASTFWFATAPILWSAVPNTEKRGGPFRPLCGVVFLGGLARLLSWRRTGHPAICWRPDHREPGNTSRTV
jgi:Domain of unknown function (DUF4345)